MLRPLSSLGVATLCCYIPTTVAAIVLYFKHRKSPVPAVWVLLLIMCLGELPVQSLVSVIANSNPSPRRWRCAVTSYSDRERRC
jgi:hypothetical protein